MTTREALLKAVLAAPDDDLPRLVYADWCEENGEAERAEFIRVHIAARRTKFGYIDTRTKNFLRLCDLKASIYPHAQRVSACGSWSKSRAFRDGQYFFPWAKAPPTAVMIDSWQPSNVRLLCDRGFVVQADCELNWWLAHGPAVVREHPVVKVVLVDREPDTYDAEGGGMWHSFQHSSICSRPNEIPHVLRQHFPKDCDGRSRESVMAGLSTALIAWAKSQPA